MNAAPFPASPACPESRLLPLNMSGQLSEEEPADLLTSRSQIASALGFRAWRDSRIKGLIALGCPIFRLPGYRRGGWRADPRALSLWMTRLRAGSSAAQAAQAETFPRALSGQEPGFPDPLAAPPGGVLSA